MKNPGILASATMRRCNLAWLFIAPFLLIAPIHECAHGQTAPTPTGTPIRSFAGASDEPLVYFGGILRTNFQSMSDTVPYEQVAGREFNIFSPENAMKMKYIEPDAAGAFNFTNADLATQFATNQSASFHGHVLVGGHRTYIPDWVFNGTPDVSSATAAMNGMIDTLVNRYSPATANPVQLWEVVNESFAPTPSPTSSTDWTQGLRNGQPLMITPPINSCNSSTAQIPNTAYDVFLNTIGPTYIEKAFREAYLKNSSARLIYNDSTSGITTNQLNYIYEMAQDFTNASRSGGVVPIDGFGFQAHQNGDQTLAQRQQVLANFNKFGLLGLNVYITELDWGAEADSDPVKNNDILDKQARRYHNYLEAALRSPALKGVQTWGITDEYTYRKSTDPCTGTPNPQPLLFDSSYAPKPAYYAVQDVLNFQSRVETLQNPGFEGSDNSGSLTPWVARNGGTLALVASGTGHSSSNALKISGRTAPNSGPSQDVTAAILSDGAGRYYVRGWAKVQTGTMSMKLTLRLADGSGTKFLSTSPTTVGTTWTQVSGWLPVTWSKTLSSAILYAESTTGMVDFYLDDVTLSDGNLVMNSSFESGLTGWTTNYGGTLDATNSSTDTNDGTTTFFYGDAGVKATNRMQPYHGVAQDITTLLRAAGKTTYQVSAKIKLLPGMASSTGEIRLRMVHDGTTTYQTVSATVTSDQWVRIDGTVSVDWTASLDSATLYLDTTDGTSSYYADDIVMRPPYTPPTQ